MNINKFKYVYFLGIGGIGMSALARYFKTQGMEIGGYDKVSKPLTKELEKEGIIIHYEDEPNLIPSIFTENKKSTLVIVTPAIPSHHKELNFFHDNGYTIRKRSEVLGLISKNKTCIAVAGTHGKTSVSALLAHLFHNNTIGCNAFIGGISKNFNSNLVLNKESDILIAEADEFDRSFLYLNPDMAVITSIDPDHLDIYKTHDEIKQAFSEFITKVSKNGKILKHKNAELIITSNQKIERYTYSLEKNSDFHAENISIKEGCYSFDFVTPYETLKNLTLPIPGLVNLENAIAALSVAYLYNLDHSMIINSLSKFEGIERRFDIRLNRDNMLYIDDYAHHPEEIKYTIHSVRKMYPERKLLGVFQPHLYSRTKMLAPEFAQSLENLDEAIILDIYPAREEPMEGVTSELITEKMKNIPVTLTDKKNLTEVLKTKNIDILLTMGAGDIDQTVKPIQEMLENKIKA
ncbi:MAG: UDP-N-acetylmuramate--L-alanine ligase [Bacteroidales bacterium]